MMEWNAIILAGGRARRLGGIDKSALVYGSATLLEHALCSVADAAPIVIVGDIEPPPAWAARVIVTAESPRFAGPAAATIAGLDALTRPRAQFTAVLAADQPLVASALPLLLEALDCAPFAGGVIAVDGEGHRQPLLAVYSTAALALAGAEARSSGSLENLGMHALTAKIMLVEVPLPAGLCADVDTPEAAHNYGIEITERRELVHGV